MEQQVSIASAKACFEKLHTFLIEITPENILNASEEQLKSCSVSRQKTMYLKSLSTAILDGLDLELLSNKSHEEIRTELIKIKGIGNYLKKTFLFEKVLSSFFKARFHFHNIYLFKNSFANRYPGST